jgi:hypothetical protein
MKERKRKGIKGMILAFATAAVLVPAAQGHVYFDSGSQAAGYSPQALKAMNERWTKLAQSYQTSRPDDRGGVRGVGTVSTSDYVDRQLANLEARSSQIVHSDDRAGSHGPGPVETPALVTSHDGFDWTDAGIGASTTLFLAALIAAAMLARKRPGLAV